MSWRSLGAAAAIGMGRASGQAAGSGRKVLVGIGLLGGNDSNNLVVPMDAGSNNLYRSGRGELALPMGSLVPIASNRLQARFGMPQEAVELAALYSSGALAVVANVGDLLCPANKAQYLTSASSVQAPDSREHTADSKIQFLRGGFVVPQWWSGLLKQSQTDLAKQIFKFKDGMTAASVNGSWISGSRTDNEEILNAARSIRVSTRFPKSGIGEQLHRAVKLAAAGANSGFGNQAISCTMGGWDLHDYELKRSAPLVSQLSQAMAAFFAATVELGLSHDVTAFTWTDFNRTFAPNATGGSDHAWGGHQLVMGGGVTGGEIYGAMPTFQVGGVDDADGNGTWIPTTASAQYAATLARWFGLSESEQRAMLPALVRFANSDLGFMAS